MQPWLTEFSKENHPTFFEVVTVMALLHQELPPTLGLGPLDPEIGEPFDRVPERRKAAIGAALSSSFGFGGCNAAIILGAI